MNLDKAHDYIVANLSALCVEILDWKHTGLLHGGEGGKLREVSGMLPEGVDSLRLAETMVADEAMEQIAKRTRDNSCEGCWLDDDVNHAACDFCFRSKTDLYKTTSEIEAIKHAALDGKDSK